MKGGQWSWVGACSTGSAHVQAQTSCDDSAACLEFRENHRSILLAIVSDGAGSADHGAVGSRIVVRHFASAAFNFLRSGGLPSAINEEISRGWLDEVRDRIFSVAQRMTAQPRDFAATLIAVFVCNDHVSICHVGDGACALRGRGADQGWLIPSWPSHGEYASSTYFVTDDPVPNLRITHLPGEFCEVAVFTDGLERLALDFTHKVAFAPFFDPIFRPLAAGLGPGRDRKLSVQLRTFLDSPVVNERTDDDKSLVLARRINH
jgi:Protein phosphatase 2C